VGVARNILSKLSLGSSKGVRNEFDGGRMRRRLKSWLPTRYTVNTILSSSGDLLRSRCRDALRNNAHANAASDSFVANLIGTGIKPSSLLSDNPDLRQAIMDLWLEWTDQCDADGLGDFYALQTIVARSIFEAGESFIRFRPRKMDDGYLVPPQTNCSNPKCVSVHAQHDRAERQFYYERDRARFSG
jgi:capsid protein